MSSSSDEPAPQPWGFACPRCGYDTHDLTSNNCPECGIHRNEAAHQVSERALVRSTSTCVANVFASMIAPMALAIAVGVLRDAHARGFYNDQHRIDTIALLAACGAGIAFPCINWIRIARRRRPLHLGIALAILALMMAMAMR